MGKFSSPLDEYVYAVSLIGSDDLKHDADGAYVLMRHGHTIFKDNDPFTEELKMEDRNKLVAVAGVILHELESGIVDVTYYDEEEDLNRDWDNITEKVKGSRRKDAT